MKRMLEREHHMEAYQREFIEFMVRSDVLTFGDFVTKSGRRTPFFINTGRYDSGAKMMRLGEFYAETIERHLPGGYDALFGPAYKGIPLVVATVMSLSTRYGRDVPFTFNRKEVKDHGEGAASSGTSRATGNEFCLHRDQLAALQTRMGNNGIAGILQLLALPALMRAMAGGLGAAMFGPIPQVRPGNVR
jgi:hypothetical protein